ncbi:MAG: hypothetical protein L3K07_01350 [Thermoplasmata archaeon]|nr:hypothetical protein [Thermoplasmata archaeon]
MRPNGIRTALLAGVSVAVVVAVVLSGLYVAAVGPFARHSGAGSAVSFAAARTLANSTAGSYRGGYPTLSLALGVDSRTSLTLPISGLLGTGGCSVSGIPGSSVSVPSTPGVAGTGLAGFWALLYRNSSGAGLVVSVEDGQAVALGTVPQPSPRCPLGGFAGSVPAKVVDSTAAASAVGHEGGSAFVTAHPNATAAYFLLGTGSTFAPAEWLVAYTLCAALSTSAAIEPEFQATVNGVAGTILGAASTNQSCSGGGQPTLGTVFAFGPPMHVSNGTGEPACAAAGGSDWCEAIPIAATGPDLRASSLVFQVEQPNGAPVVFAGAASAPSLAVEAANGVIVARYSFASSSWVSGGSLPLSTTQVFLLDLGCTVSGSYVCSPNPVGLYLVAEGVGSLSGSVASTLV